MERHIRAEDRNGRASALTDNSDQATVGTILDDRIPPTAIEPAGDTLWVGDRGAAVLVCDCGGVGQCKDHRATNAHFLSEGQRRDQ